MHRDSRPALLLLSLLLLFAFNRKIQLRLKQKALLFKLSQLFSKRSSFPIVGLRILFHRFSSQLKSTFPWDNSYNLYKQNSYNFHKFSILLLEAKIIPHLKYELKKRNKARKCILSLSKFLGKKCFEIWKFDCFLLWNVYAAYWSSFRCVVLKWLKFDFGPSKRRVNRVKESRWI